MLGSRGYAFVGLTQWVGFPPRIGMLGMSSGSQPTI
jgi:hypothetical protein